MKSKIMNEFEENKGKNSIEYPSFGYVTTTPDGDMFFVPIWANIEQFLSSAIDRAVRAYDQEAGVKYAAELADEFLDSDTGIDKFDLQRKTALAKFTEETNERIGEDESKV